MGLIIILHRPHINLVIRLVASEPFNEHNPPAVINGRHQPIVIPFDIKHDAVSPKDAGVSVILLYIGGLLPFGLPGFLEPSIQSGLYHPVVHMAGQARNEPHQRIAGDNAHNHTLPCSHNGHNEDKKGTRGINYTSSPTVLNIRSAHALRESPAAGAPAGAEMLFNFCAFALAIVGKTRTPTSTESAPARCPPSMGTLSGKKNFVLLAIALIRNITSAVSYVLKKVLGRKRVGHSE